MPRPRIQKPSIDEITKAQFHPRNKHQGRYNFVALVAANPKLEEHIVTIEAGTHSIDFFNPESVKELNRAILMKYYGIGWWDIPEGYLVPPIPGRADYIHFTADLMSGNYPKRTTDPIPTGTQIRCLDIGVGANCVYPIIAKKEYGWAFVGVDIDTQALSSAQKIIDENKLSSTIELRKQDDEASMFKGVIKKDEYFDVSVCNPPFHSSQEEAEAANKRKVQNLKGEFIDSPSQNFGGVNTELWCEGGELNFVSQYIKQSKEVEKQVLWFTILISKKENVRKALRLLEKMEALNVQVIEMTTGSKQSRLVGWTFKNRKGRKTWHRVRWEVK